MIMGFLGPEGAGKSCIMAAYCLAHVSQGGKLYSFPGYEIHHPVTGEVLSEEITVEQWITIPEDLTNTVIAIDEMGNFFDSYTYNTVMARIFGYLEAQRRKRSMGILFTVQEIDEIPKRLRRKTHIMASCYDLYWKYRNSEEPIKRGEKIAVTFYDCKGFYTGEPWRRSRPKVFKAKPYWDIYDTYGIVDVFEAFTKVNIKGKKVTVDMNANPEYGGEADFSSVQGILSRNGKPTVNEGLLASQLCQAIYDSNKDQIPTTLVQQMARDVGLDVVPQRLGNLMGQYGWKSKKKTVDGKEIRVYLRPSEQTTTVHEISNV